MDKREDLIRRIKDCLAIYAVRVDMDKGEASRAAETFYCGLLNILMGYDLQNMNLLRPNYPAIDLGDAAEGLGVQVTSTATRGKVQDTLDAMFRNDVQKGYPHLVMLITKEWRESRKAFRMDGVCQFEPDQDIWDTNWLLAKIEGIMELEKLEEIQKHLKRHLYLVREPVPTLNLPLQSALAEGAFVGREEELAQIGERFETGKVVVLSGLGGMGKTELAVRYGRDHEESGRGWAYFLHFSGSFARTLRDNVTRITPDYSVEGKTDEQIEADAMAALNRCGKEDLLILDNADEGSMTGLRRELSKLHMRVLVTTRKDVTGAVPVEPLARAELYAIFEQNGVDISKAEMDALIDAVNGHTLTVDVMARTMRRGRRSATPEKLLDALKKRDLSKGFTKVEIAYAGSPEQARINEHLKAVFRVAELSVEEQTLLRCAALLPESGMDDELFLVPFKEDTGDTVDDLVEGGWLYMEKGLLRIHPVIRIVCIEVLEPTDENCGAFLLRMVEQYNPAAYDKDKFCQLAELFGEASGILEDHYGEWALRAGYFWGKLGDVRKALEYNLQMMGAREQNMSPDAIGLADAYQILNTSYNVLGEYKRALNCALEALRLYLQHFPEEHLLIARTYNNIGVTYGYLKEFRKALEYKLKDLEICKKILPPMNLDLALSLSNVGATYDDLGDFEKALEYKLEAHRILENILPRMNPDLATSYNNLGVTYRNLGDNRMALECFLKALEISELILPAEHPDLAISCNNVSGMCSAMGDYKKALEYQLKGLNILEKVYPPNHPDLVTAYDNMVIVCCALGDKEKELVYRLKALEVLGKESSGANPQLAAACNNIAAAYARMDNLEKAVVYIRQAVEIGKKTLPEWHPDLDNYQYGMQMLEYLLMLRQEGISVPNPFV